ncbi:stage II sporulation protein SpoIID [Synergistales bacterium]|nr:stage II sporulation protein SpoIID [Synergistales bacterium]
MKSKRKIFVIYPVFLILFLFFTQDAAQARDIYVKLSGASANLNISSDGGLKLIDASKKSHSLGKSVTLTRSGKYPLPARVSGGSLLSFNGRKYRGVFLITKNFTLINILDVEDYLRGVLPAEAGPSQSEEYLRAHAITSRTYALKQSLSRGSRGYDVLDSTSDQVYKGAGVETSATDKAVRATAGEVLTYGSELASTFFHSDSGGHTASVAEVWEQDIPYLRGVKEPMSYKSPNSSWTAKISSAKVQAALSKLKANVGKPKEIRVSETDRGGRAVKLTFVGSGGSAIVKASDFRVAVGSNLLKSTMLTGAPPHSNRGGDPRPPVHKPAPVSKPTPAPTSNLAPTPPVPTSDAPLTKKEDERMSNMTRNGVFTASELMDMLKNPKKMKGYFYIGLQRSGLGKLPENPPEVRIPDIPSDGGSKGPIGGSVIIESGGNFVFHGKGWGHGVGLSQYGAMALAAQGWKAERILEHYYSGAVVKKFK